MPNPRVKLVLVALLTPIFVAAQAINPRDAIALEQQGQLPEAARAWKMVIERNPSDAAAFASLGVVLSKKQKYQKAASAYRKALARGPNLSGVDLNLGLAEFKQGHFRAATAALRLALAKDPPSSQVRTLLGLSYYGEQRFCDPIKLEQAAKNEPGNTELDRLLGQSCLWARDYPCALEGFRQLLDESPESFAPHVRSREALDGLGGSSEAMTEFETAGQFSPNEPDVHFALGYLYWKSQQCDQAKQEFAHELALDPTNAQALAYLGDIEWKNYHPDGAVPLVERAIRSNKNLRMAFVNLGAVKLQQKSLSRRANDSSARGGSRFHFARCPLAVRTYESGHRGRLNMRRKNSTRCRSCTKGGGESFG